MRIDYLGLEAFVAIADLGSFQRAAVHLNLSQTALSHRVRKIESELGTRLLVRTTRRVSLTRSGQELLPQVRRHLNELSEIYSDARKRGRAKQVRLSFACLPTIANYYLPQVMRRFAAEWPDIALQLHDQPVSRITELVQSGDAEFGITIVGASNWGLETRPICTEPYILLVPKDHPLATRESVTRGDLAGMAFARITTQSTNRQLVEDALGEYSDSVLWRYEVQNATTAMALVAEGAALTVLPKMTANLTRDDLVALPFSDVEMSRTLGAISRRGTPLSEPAASLLEMIRERLSEI